MTMIMLGITKIVGVPTMILNEIIAISKEDMQIENLEIAGELDTGEIIYKEIGTEEYLVKCKFIPKNKETDKELMQLYFSFIKDTGLLFSKRISLKNNILTAELRHKNIKAIRQIVRYKNKEIIKPR